MSFKQKKPKKTLSISKMAETVRPKVPLLEILPFKHFEGTDNLLVLADDTGKDGSYLDMLTIIGKDLDFVYGANSEGAGRIIWDYHMLLNVYTTDFDILITQISAETVVQQQAWLANRDRIAMAQETDTCRYRQLQIQYELTDRQIKNLRHVAEKVKHQSYTAFIYGDNTAEARLNRDIFMNSGGQAITTKKMSLEKKKTMLSILQDPTQQLDK